MDFVAIEPRNWAIIGSLFVLAMALGIFFIAFPAAKLASHDSSTPRFRGVVLPIIALVVGVVSFAGTLAWIFQSDLAKVDVRNTAVIEQIEQTYGEELDSIRGLHYPSEKPTEDFKVFGSYNRDEPTAAGFERTETFLVWKGGQMILASSADGEIFDELER